MSNGIAERLERVRHSLPSGVDLVAVSKFHPVESLRQAWQAGQRVFGESRAQELAAKAPQMPPETQWHFIGHLQTNKVRPVVAVASMIESIDSLRLLKAVEAEARKAGRQGLKLLLEVHVAAEQTKTGFSPAELANPELLQAIASLEACSLEGVMGMASLTDDPARIAADFQAIADARRRLQELTGLELPVLSMGMSDDYPLAVQAGATQVRVGSLIFGPRQY